MKKFVRLFIYFCLFAIVIGMFVYLGKKDYGKNVVKQTDSEKFHQEYPEIPIENNFNYLNTYDTYNLIKNGTGILYLGFSSNEWSQYYVKYMYEVLEDKNLDNIYYYDLLKDRTRQSKYYNEIVDLLSSHLYRSDSSTAQIYTPCLLFIKNGKIIFYDDETAIGRNNVSPSDYWTENRIT